MRYALPSAIVIASLTPAGALAADTPSPPLPTEVQVIGITPLLGSGIDRDRLPATTNVLGQRQIDRTDIPSLTGAILENIPSSSVTETSSNAFQPDINFRGFTASPAAGTAQGLAVYVNGARFNDPFGDTVNWDLIPPAAIDTVNIESSNPIFGLNALGGSVNIRLKNGFNYHGGDLTTYGGSYDRGVGILEYGHQFGNFAIYGSGDVSHDGGFRQTQSSDLYRLYTDLGYRNEDAEIHLGINAASTALGNPGANPVQALAADQSAIFTGPNTVYNKYVALNLNGNLILNEKNSLQSVAYFQNLTQRLPNGITEELNTCSNQPGVLCNNDLVTPVTTLGGQIVPDFRHGGFYSGLVQEGLDSHAYGASTQLTNESTLLAHRNHFVFGGSFDGSDNVYAAHTSIGGLTYYSHLFIGPGVIINEPDEGINPVRVVTVTRYYGLFADDLFSITPKLDLNLAGRFNNAEVDLHDKLGGPVFGQHSYSRFNPSAGLTYRVTPSVTLYGNYTETNRAPTPTELSCASAATPCSLLNFFVGDPNLKQVVAHTFEIGARGRVGGFLGGKLAWDVDYYHTKTRDDLIYESTLTNVNLQYFTNAGSTLRQGVEANLVYNTPRLRLLVGYAFADAAFQSILTLNSLNNPGADANGQIHVVPGNRIPGIPLHRGTIVADYRVTDRWTIGSSTVLQGSVFRFGDEANLTKQVGGYILLSLNTSYRLTGHVTVFGLVNNVTARRYDTYGTFGPIADAPWPFVPGGVTDPRTAVPGMPIAGYGGVKVVF